MSSEVPIDINSIDLNSLQLYNNNNNKYNTTRKPILNDYESSILVCFNQSYSFKTLIEYLKENNDIASFKFTKEGIKCMERSKNGNILNEIEIKGYKLLEYHFESIHDELIYSFELKDLSHAIKKIATKTDPPLVIVKEPMSSTEGGETFHFHSIKFESGGISSTNFIRPANGTDIEEFFFVEYSDERKSNIKLQISRLVDLFSLLSDNKTKLKFKGYSSLLTIKIDAQTNGVGSLSEVKSDYDHRYILDKLDEDLEDEKELIKMTLDSKVLKALEKIGTLGDKNQILYIYIEKDKPLKFKCNIGSFGKLRIYISGR